MRSAAALLITAVLVSLMGCGSSRNLAAQRAESIDRLRAENDVLRARLAVLRDSLAFYNDVKTGRYYRDLRLLKRRADRMRYAIEAWRDGGRTFAVIPTDRLFKPASATLTPAGRTRLDTLAAHLWHTKRPIRVEGYADNQPLSASLKETYPSNWELSAARAAAVVRYLIAAHAFKPARFRIIAYGSTRPVRSNETAAGRRHNRRVRVALLPEPHDFARPEVAW